MKLRVDATEQELRESSDKLLRSVGSIIGRVDPELSDAIEKAMPHKESELKFPVLRALNKKVMSEYSRQTELMLDRIIAVVNKSVVKSEYSANTDYSSEIVDKEQDNYDNAKKLLVSNGYKDDDFEVGGSLHGYSTNELIVLAREKRQK